MKLFRKLSRDDIRLLIEVIALASVIYSLYLTREALHAGTRPIVVADNVRISEFADDPAKLEFDLNVKNIGDYPVRNIWFEVEMDQVTSVSFEKYKFPMLHKEKDGRIVCSFTRNDGESVSKLANSIRSGEVETQVVLHYSGMNGKEYRGTYVYFPAKHISQHLQETVPEGLKPPDLSSMPTLLLIDED